jgi:hypothetical protein
MVVIRKLVAVSKVNSRLLQFVLHPWYVASKLILNVLPNASHRWKIIFISITPVADIPLCLTSDLATVRASCLAKRYLFEIQPWE